MAATQIESSQPHSAPGEPFQPVIPRLWGKTQTFRKVATPAASKLLEDLLDSAGDPSPLPSQTFELTGILVQNFSEVSVWWGDENVEPGFGTPILAGTDPRDESSVPTDQPGHILFTGVDPEEIFVTAPSSGEVELIVQLFGKFTKAGSTA